jgi:hypothetical protein
MASAHQKRFGAASKRCFAKGPTSAKEFGRCMKSELGGGKRKKSGGKKRRKSRKSRK